MTPTPLLALAALAASLASAAADPAKPASLTIFTGNCHAYDVDEARGVAPSPCAGMMNEIVFVDGFSSLQFTATDGGGKELRRVAFVGPRWVQIDDTHSAMVVSQLSAATLPPTQLKPTSPSGFCLFTTKARSEGRGEPSSIACQYNAGGATHMFVLSDMVKKDGFGVQ